LIDAAGATLGAFAMAVAANKKAPFVQGARNQIST